MSSLVCWVCVILKNCPLKPTVPLKYGTNEVPSCGGLESVWEKRTTSYRDTDILSFCLNFPPCIVYYYWELLNGRSIHQFLEFLMVSYSMPSFTY